MVNFKGTDGLWAKSGAFSLASVGLLGFRDCAFSLALRLRQPVSGFSRYWREPHLARPLNLGFSTTDQQQLSVESAFHVSTTSATRGYIESYL